MNTLKRLLNTWQKQANKHKGSDGFTLIELLVAMILAFLIITPLLGFMIDVLNTDRQEQAKANTEQDVQAAIDFITRDLQQALYIYDAAGVNAIKSQLPTVTNGVAVLVFWKREFTKETAITKTKVAGVDTTFNDDSFVYSLVAYFLVKDNSTTWSKSSRIARFQIQDGVLNSNGSKTCTGYGASKYSVCPDAGFKAFDLSQKGKTLQEKMNSWTKATENYKQTPLVVVDFIDSTTTTKGAPTATCASSDFSIVPPSTTTEMTGFYTCAISVGSDNRSVAEVYLRGNALARLTEDETKMVYNQQKASYFPNVKVRVQGRSFVFTK